LSGWRTSISDKSTKESDPQLFIEPEERGGAFAKVAPTRRAPELVDYINFGIPSYVRFFGIRERR